jgi:hypothetical protein
VAHGVANGDTLRVENALLWHDDHFRFHEAP